jgi:hypothetical protein
MADAPERAAVAPGPVVAPLPATLESSEPYKPLSLLAIAGFALAVVYAAAVTVGGLAVLAGRHAVAFRLLLVLVPLGALLAALLRQARQPGQIASFVGLAVAGAAAVLGLGSLVVFSGSNPWLLPDVMWVVVVAAGVVSWLALGRIQASEGTLSGTSLARWGLGLSLFFGINYAAYLASNVLAFRSQARACADEFLDLLRQGDVNGAFIRTLETGSRPGPGVDPRPELEVKHNTSRTPDGGMLSQFDHSDLVRLLRLGGPSTTFEPQAVSADLEGGTYRGTLHYKATTPHGNFEVTVTAVGKDTAGSGRRQWHVVQNGTGIVRPLSWTDEGIHLNELARATREFARQWGQKWVKGQVEEAYLDTLPVVQRRAQAAAWECSTPAVLAAAGLAPMTQWTQGPAADAFRAGRKAFAETPPLVQGSDVFWADDRYRKAVIDQVRQLFAGPVSVPVDFRVSQTTHVPITRKVDDRIQQDITCRLTVQQPTGGTPFGAEVEVVVEAPAKPVRPALDQLRVASVRLIRAQSASPSPEGGPPPR